MEFWKLGVQYYAAARSAVQSGLLPVCGNLFHHAIEAFLKARFSLTLSLNQVKRLAGKTGHELPPLWNAFKAEFPGAGLEQFDDAIAAVQPFERLRYPDAIVKEGAQILVGKFITPPRPNAPPRYQVDPPAIDHLVGKLFELCSRNPVFFMVRMNSHGREAIMHNNPIGERFVPKC